MKLPLPFILTPFLLAAMATAADNDSPLNQKQKVDSSDKPFDIKDKSSSRMVKHDGGAYSTFEKSSDGKAMRKLTYNARDILVSLTYYRRGAAGELRSCLIFDGRKNELFYVNYGYNGKAQLVEERMYDSKTKGIVRRFLYTYDSVGHRSKPICITLVKNNDNVEKYGDQTAPEKDPFAEDFRRQQQRK